MLLREYLTYSMSYFMKYKPYPPHVHILPFEHKLFKRVTSRLE